MRDGFNIDIAYMDVGKGREQDAVALKRDLTTLLPHSNMPWYLCKYPRST